MEWTLEFLCTVDGTIVHSVQAAFMPSHSVIPQKSILYIIAG